LKIEWGPGFVWLDIAGSEPVLVYMSKRFEVEGTFVKAALDRWCLSESDVLTSLEAKLS
jgi:hypothetical protein